MELSLQKVFQPAQAAEQSRAGEASLHSLVHSHVQIHGAGVSVTLSLC